MGDGVRHDRLPLRLGDDGGHGSRAFLVPGELRPLTHTHGDVRQDLDLLNYAHFVGRIPYGD